MMSNPPAALADAIAADAPKTSEDTLERLRKFVRQQRDGELEIKGLEERLVGLKAAQLTLEHKTLPEMFSEAKVDQIGLPAEGNLPAYLAELKPYYKASIGAEWPPEKRAAAFDWLKGNDAGDLIKSVVVIEFPKEQVKFAETVVRQQLAKKRNARIEMTVPWNTLTAWLKEQVEVHQTTPPLDTLGATVGKVVKLKPRKEK